MTGASEIRQEVMEAAFEWRALMADKEASTADRLAFSVWLREDPAHPVAYARAQAFWQELGGLDAAALDADFFRPSRRERSRAALRRALKGLCTRKAAPALGALAGVCALLLFVWLHGGAGLFDQEPREYVFATAIGEVRDVDLEDGSRITLGPVTTIRVRMEASARRVEMSTGEAFFQVAKNPGRPFTVDSGELRVTVRGTAFDIRRSETSTEVAVAEGVVSVSHPALDATAAGVPAGAGGGPQQLAAGRVLLAGQRFASRLDGGGAAVSGALVESIGAWRRQVLVYIDAPLSEIVADMNRHQGRPIRIRGEGVGAIRVTATFNSADTENMLAALAGAVPVRVEFQADGITLTRAE